MKRRTYISKFRQSQKLNRRALTDLTNISQDSSIVETTMRNTFANAKIGLVSRKPEAVKDGIPKKPPSRAKAAVKQKETKVLKSSLRKNTPKKSQSEKKLRFIVEDDDNTPIIHVKEDIHTTQDGVDAAMNAKEFDDDQVSAPSDRATDIEESFAVHSKGPKFMSTPQKSRIEGNLGMIKGNIRHLSSIEEPQPSEGSDDFSNIFKQKKQRYGYGVLIKEK